MADLDVVSDAGDRFDVSFDADLDGSKVVVRAIYGVRYVQVDDLDPSGEVPMCTAAAPGRAGGGAGVFGMAMAVGLCAALRRRRVRC